MNNPTDAEKDAEAEILYEVEEKEMSILRSTRKAMVHIPLL